MDKTPESRVSQPEQLTALMVPGEGGGTNRQWGGATCVASHEKDSYHKPTTKHGVSTSYINIP